MHAENVTSDRCKAVAGCQKQQLLSRLATVFTTVRFSFVVVFRQHCSHSMRMQPIATDGVAWSSGLSVGDDPEPCRKGKN